MVSNVFVYFASLVDELTADGCSSSTAVHSNINVGLTSTILTILNKWIREIFKVMDAVWNEGYSPSIEEDKYTCRGVELRKFNHCSGISILFSEIESQRIPLANVSDVFVWGEKFE